ncbi:MAG: hypothetical protein HC903_28915 [Methylacidiphilales bacterium]|nr:hypothetical protein [Candidatus Methylacidiphilales bacterium]NJR19258.1 hypothetical protein [Calothrix sp. CSU_2_0]
MQYKLNPLYSTEKAFNGDVIISDEEKYMGRLYILATSDRELLNLGIEKEWFLAHAPADALICGHINHEGGWSLSSYRSLEPSLIYVTQNQIFDQVFSPEYVWEISYLREETTLNIFQTMKDSDDSNSNKDSDSDVPNEKYVTKIVEKLYITSANIDALRDLILRSSVEELFVLEPEQEIEIHSNQIVDEQQEINFTEIMNYFQRESAPKLDEEELSLAQMQLTERVIAEYEKQNINEFSFVPFGNVTIHPEESYFVLRDSEDEHTIFIATFDADIIQGLNDTDALKVEMILSQLDTEDYRRMRDTNEQEIEANKTEIKQQLGMEYGA